jgi:hypothetical protein
LFGSILEQISECNNINKKNSIKTLKMTTRNNKSYTRLKGANERNLKSYYDLWGFRRQRKSNKRAPNIHMLVHEVLLIVFQNLQSKHRR